MSAAVKVGLEDRAYEVMIGPGLIAAAGAHMAPLLKRGRVAVISDETVWGLHGSSLTAALAQAGVAVSPIVVPPGEGSKSFDMLARSVTICWPWSWTAAT